jgi:hypothetical protein
MEKRGRRRRKTQEIGRYKNLRIKWQKEARTWEAAEKKICVSDLIVPIRKFGRKNNLNKLNYPLKKSKHYLKALTDHLEGGSRVYSFDLYW